MRSAMLALLMASAIGMDKAVALDYGSIAEECHDINQTNFCGEAFTRISQSEVFHIQSIDVGAAFFAPSGYDSEGASKNIVGWNPLTWNVRVHKNPIYCAFSGFHETQGIHTVFFNIGGSAQFSSSSSFFRWYCDCETSPY
jgi:hypothetical protein